MIKLNLTHKSYSILLVIVFLLLSSTLLSGIETQISGLQGSQISSSSSVTVLDQDFSCLSGATSSASCREVAIENSKLYAKLWFEEGFSYPTNMSWSLTVQADVDGVHNLGTHTESVTLEVTYHPTDNYIDIDYHQLSTNYQYLSGTLKNIVITKTGLPNIPLSMHLDIVLENEKSTRMVQPGMGTGVTVYDPQVYWSTSTHDKTKNELTVYWDYIEGAENYDLEWLFIDVGDDNFTEDFDYNFKNATRINTSNNHYTISLAYPKGLLLFRVRGRNPYNKDQGFGEGSWSAKREGTVLASNNYAYEQLNIEGASSGINPLWSIGNSKAFQYEGMDPNKNWQYSATFAEEGKRKEVASFYDGALYNRQTVTFTNTNNKAILGQTVYDFTGRPAVHVLPSPLTSTGVHYYDDRGSTDVRTNASTYDAADEVLSQNSAGAPYSFKDFDFDPLSGNVTVPLSMDKTNSIGAANYYSPSNTQTGVHQDYIADASGIVFSTTQYANDGTNRVLRQSGVGTKHQINSGHETKYLYGVPGSQQELDRLFYNNVGPVINYKKNIVKDANGEISVSYIDGKGRTIATALSGKAENLEELDTYPGDANLPTLTANLTDFNQVVNDSTLVTTKTILVASSMPLNFYYSLPAEVYTNCITGDCKYNLTIYLLNEESGNRIELSGANVNTTTNQVEIFEATSINTFSFSTIGNVDFGTYQLVKELTVSQSNAESLYNYYIENQDCLPFTPPALVSTCDSCEKDCEDQYSVIDPLTQNRYLFNDYGDTIGEKLYSYNFNTGVGTYGSWTIFTPENPISNDISGDYSAITGIITSCVEACSTETDDISLCEIKYEELLADMSPGGQYFDNTPDIGEVGYDVNGWLSIASPPYESSLIDYLNSELGGTTYTWNDVRANWNEDWAKILIKAHPEYCAFSKFCCISEQEIGNSSGTLITGADDLTIDIDGGPNNEVEIKCNEVSNSTIENIFEALTSYTDFLGSGLTLENYISTNPDGVIGTGQNQISSSKFEEFHTNRLLEEAKYAYTLTHCAPDFPLAHGADYGYTSDGFYIHYPEIDWDGSSINASSSCNTMCESTISKWVQEFKCIEALTTVDSIAYVTALKEICQKGCPSTPQDAIPPGASTISLTINGVSTPVSSFEEATQFVRNQITAISSTNIGHCPTPKFPESVSEENCGCDKIFQFALDQTTYDYLNLPATLDLGSELYSLTGDNLSYNYSVAYDKCMDGKPISSVSLPEMLTCDNTSISFTALNYDSLCVDLTNAQNYANAKKIYDDTIKARAIRWKKAFIDKCVQNAVDHEQFYYEYQLSEYHYTLYFYDQADNLTATVPPEGVFQKNIATGVVKHDVTGNAPFTDIQNHRDDPVTNPTFHHADYAMWTNYKYNSLQQLIEQTTPDGGRSKFYYDKLGRLVASQNAEQETRNAYSYTIYDDLSRITEVGEAIHTTPLTNEIARDLDATTSLNTWMTTFASNKNIVKTYYDELLGNTDNYRNRIAYVAHDEDGDGSNEAASLYRYDINGNVKEIVQYNGSLFSLGHDEKTIAYEYDLVSGNVNKVTYQKGEEDQFSHKYSYDADNRLVEAYTSRDDIIWEKEAKYFYYAHGPLARVELGDKQVQAQDYAYTLQGWLKAINSSTGHHDSDIGKDGVYAGVHSHFARDVYGMSLHYYGGDYLATGGGSPTNNLLASTSNIVANNLYNGNISKIITSLTNENEVKQDVVGKGFGYDELNRIKTSNVWFEDPTSNFTDMGSPFSTSTDYYSDYTYDGNGNIEELTRNGYAASTDGVNMDNFKYAYQDLVGIDEVKITNKLDYVNDVVGSTPGYGNDLEPQSVGNYTYDEIGRLIADNNEEIQEIKWNVSNKITEIIRTSGSTKPHLKFAYDAFGNRVSKQVSSSSGTETTYYVRDAQGNVLSTYSQKNGGDFKLNDFTLYGSSRLGTRTENLTLVSPGELTFSNINGLTINTWLQVQILKTASTNWWNGNAQSDQKLVGAGYIKWTLDATTSASQNIFVGLLDNNTSNGWLDIDYAWHTSSSVSYVYENGSNKSPGGSYTGGDIFLIERDASGNITYKKNGSVIYPSGVTNTSDLTIDIALYQQNVSKITSLELSDGFKTLHFNGSSSSSSHDITYRELGNKQYELTNHLGNVLQTISDRKLVHYTSYIDENFNSGGIGSFTDDPNCTSSNPPTENRMKVISSTQYSGPTWTFATTIGETYTIKFDADVGTAGSLGGAVYESSSPVATIWIGTTGTYTITFTATTTSAGFKFYTQSTGTSQYYLDNFKVGTDIYYQADVKSYSHYYPFGMKMPGRYGSENESYRYGFNGMESDDEMYEQEGNSYTAEFWQYDSRLGRRWNIDPVVKVHESPYATFANNPVIFIDPNGDDTLRVFSNSLNENGTKWKEGDKRLLLFTAYVDNETNNVIDLKYGQYQKKYQNIAEGAIFTINGDDKSKIYARILFVNNNDPSFDNAVVSVSLEQINSWKNKAIKTYKESAHISDNTFKFDYWFGGEELDAKAHPEMMNEYPLVYIEGVGLHRSDIVGNMIYGAAWAMFQSLDRTLYDGDYAQDGGIDDAYDSYGLMLGHLTRGRDITAASFNTKIAFVKISKKVRDIWGFYLYDNINNYGIQKEKDGKVFKSTNQTDTNQ